MSLEETKARIKAQVSQAMAKSKLDLSPLSKETREQLIDIVAQAALLEIDDHMGQTAKANKAAAEAVANANLAVAQALDDDGKEEILWEGRPFMSLSVMYRITDERVRITEGLLSKNREDIELARIKDIDQHQNLSERLLDLGDITIISHDSSQPTIVLRNIKDPQGVHEILRRAILNARKKFGVVYREQI